VIVRPSYRKGLRLGVAAATEHHSVAFEHRPGSRLAVIDGVGKVLLGR